MQSDTVYGEHTFTVGDRAVSLADTLVDADGFTPRNLTGCTVAFHLREAGATDDDAPGAVIISSAAATIDSEGNGEVSYAFSADDMADIEASLGEDQSKAFWGWWIRTIAATGKRETFPSKGKLRIIFNADPTA